MNRAAALRSHLQTGKSICPFAKTCSLEITAPSTDIRADRAAVLHGMMTFAASRGNALVLLAPADGDFTAVTAWAREAFLELMICCSRINHPTVSITEIENHVERTVRPMLESQEIRPHLALHARPLMTICMAPVYPTTHPRYAPHTILVITWSDDVRGVQDTKAASKIREIMVKTHGCVYDANELVLPLPTTTGSDTSD